MNNGDRYVQLGDCSEIRTGQTFKNSLQGSTEGNLHVLLPRDVLDNKIVSTPIKIDGSQVPMLSKHLLRLGEILIANKGTKFNTFLYEGQFPNAIATSSFFVLTPNPVLLSPYLNWYLNQPPARQYFAQHAFGTTIPSINKLALSELSIPLIPLQEQQYIIEFIRESKYEQQLLEDLHKKRVEFCNSYIWERILKL